MTRSRRLRYSVIGFVLGTLSSTAYLLFGSWGLFYSPDPLWAQIVFLPGLFAGHRLYEAGCHSIPVCVAVGVASMGLVTSLAALPIATVVDRQSRYPEPASGSA